jgi:hypothetical protein
MVDSEIRDPDRIAALLRDELEGLEEPPFDTFSVEGGDGTAPGTPTFTASDAAGKVLQATKGPERLAVEVTRRPDAVAEAAEDVGLRARPKATTPPATVLLVPRAADVKGVIDALRAIEGER